MTRRYVLVLVVLLIAVLALAAPVGAAVVTISVSHLASTDISNLNTAISNAGSGGTVILNPGTYFIYGITVTNSVTIQANTSYGHTAADTIIDGTQNGNSIFTVTGGNPVVFDNLTLENGGLPPSSTATLYGGAIDNGNIGTAVTVTSSTFTECNATQGGAISISSGTVSITASSFTNCHAPGSSNQGGGAIYNSGGTITTITSSTFTGCTATYVGGAIYNDNGGTITTIATTTFSGCKAGNGGAIDNRGGGTISTITTIISSTFTGCTADGGGAINNGGTITTIATSTFTGCTASTTGGAIYNGDTIATIATTTFSGCTSNWGGAICNYGGTIATIQFSRFFNNAATYGPAIANYYSINSAIDNWWGTNAGASGYVSGYSPASGYSPWLNLTVTAIPSSITTTQTAVIRANLTYEWTGSDTASGGTFVPNGIPVAYSLSGVTGTFGVTGGNITYGANSTVFTPTSAGTAELTVTIDSQQVTVPVTVTPTPLTGIGVPTGTPYVGNILPAGAVTPAGATATLQWNEAASSAGPFVPVSGATGSTYTLTSSDIGKFLEVSATGTGLYTGFANSMPVGPVTTPLTGIGATTGTTQVGFTLTNGTVTPAGATVSMQWNESANLNGPYTPIAGATGFTYVLQSSDVGKYIEANATGTGLYSGSANSTPVGPVTAVATPTSSSGGHSSGRNDYWASTGSSNDVGYTGQQPAPIGVGSGSTSVTPQATPVTSAETPPVIEPTHPVPPVQNPSIVAMVLLALQEYQFWLILCVVAVILVAVLRRWWTRRQNPALFRKYD